ncbi:RimK family alpha-L-glutamate ligase [Fictibacillus enclensis]|uniref:ATP-grasp domain-containing protein n=1 Tax=Fictibacillus enclensis TaxID=1017270 RepID=UPI0025A21591|nr:RimK family alpha-L-glutamate ligase [Fictibacillus enclensis]MDM5337949.1 RimK family alpha-L-glutamate ligase [Fictibacillus enclensis]
MKLVTFNPFRTIGIPNVQYVKPDHMFKELVKIKQADVLLFPENWQVNSLVYGMKKRIFPSIESIQLGYSKMEMTRALWTVCPENVPYTEILGNSKDSRQKVLETFPFPFVAKEIRNSMGKGVFLVNNEEDFYTYAEANDVLYVQEYLPIDRDLRVCVVGDEIIGSYWRIGSNGFHNNVSQGGSISFDQIPEEALELVRQTAKALNVNHAGFDIVAANGKYYILEFNVLFGNQAFNHLEVSPEKKIYEYLVKAEA